MFNRANVNKYVIESGVKGCINSSFTRVHNGQCLQHATGYSLLEKNELKK
jgi:hypothetical protein